uniref:Uncharacterized protein n=1 Tax=Anguilla anguilla TaxID=7936 RepID=A0A0E9SPJ1_ANGAN
MGLPFLSQEVIYSVMFIYIPQTAANTQYRNPLAHKSCKEYQKIGTDSVANIFMHRDALREK